MSDTPPEDTTPVAPAAGAEPAEPKEPEAAAEPELPPYVIEGARSSRARCKTCRRKIDKGVLRIGVLIEGPYGTGYMWHHLNCAAKRRWDDVAEAYRVEAWNDAKEPPEKVPALEKLMEQREQAEEKKKQRKEIPYVELDPSGRAKCKHCGEPLEKGKLRVVMGRDVEFGNQVRLGPANVHPRCVAEEMKHPESGIEAEGFAAAIRANSGDIDAAALEQVLAEIGDVG